MSTARLLLPLLLLVAAAAACGGDGARAGAGGGGGGGGTGEPGWPLRFGGPLANAGADRRTLAGMPVRLDGRASQAGEEGLPITFRWTQEAGPRVVLDDPTAAEPWFVAPPIRPRQGTRLVFLLTVDDGSRTARDRVVVELVDRPEQLLPAPVAVAGADLVVRPGGRVDLGAPRTFDPACLDEGGVDGCEQQALPFAFTQVEGPPVALEGTAFEAPGYEALLTFRLDAHRRGPEPDPAACAAFGPLESEAFCTAPDFVRVLVHPEGRRLDSAPRAGLTEPAFPAQQGGLFRVTDGGRVLVRGETSDQENDRIDARGFRPLLDGAPAGRLDRDTQVIALAAGMREQTAGLVEGGWPRTVAVAFETRAARLWSAPAVALLRWEPPASSALPVAHAGDPCPSGQVCLPFVGGDTVVLDGSASSDADTAGGDLVFCWYQTFGPQVTFVEGSSCQQGVPTRRFVAPEAPAGGAPLELAFLLTVDDGGPLLGLPDTTVIQVRPNDNQPPEVVLIAPEAVDEQSIVRLDASGSFDPEGRALTFDWRQLPAAGTLPVELREPERCAEGPAGGEACVEFDAPSVTRDTPLRFQLTVADDAAVAATRIVTVLVRNSNNDPPAVDAGRDRAVRPGTEVAITGEADDPNPGENAGLRWRWTVLEGDVELAGADGPEVRFTTPETESDLDLVLELTVEDEGGAAASDRITVSVLAAGPWLSPAGDDEAHGSTAAPVATLDRALAIAAEAGFGAIHLDAGTWVVADAELSLAGVRLRGGYDAAAGWSRTGTAESRLVVPGGLHLGENAGLEQLAVAAPQQGTAAQVLRVDGAVELVAVEVDGSALGAAGAAAIRLQGGVLLATGGTIRGPASATEGSGLHCEAAARIELRSASVDGGGSGRSTGVLLGAGCGGLVQESWIVGGQGGEEAVGLDFRGGAELLLERSTLEGGAAASVTGARLRTGTLEDTILLGGEGVERIGLEVPASLGCSGQPCVVASGGRITGGTGSASGSAVGVRALAALELDGVERITGSEGDVQTATGVQLLAGGTLRSIGVLRAVVGGSAASATGLLAAGTTFVEDAGDWAAGSSSGDAICVDVRGTTTVAGATALVGSASGAGDALAIRVGPGASLSIDGALRIEGGGATGSSTGIDVQADVSGTGTLQLANAVVLASSAPTSTALRSEGDVVLHSALLRVRPGVAASASALHLEGGTASLRNLILDAGGGGADRAHLRVTAGNLPSILERVLFASDVGCGGGAAYVRTAGGSAACTLAAIASLDASWEPLVGDPLFEDAAADDYRLRSASPGVDAGTSTAAPQADVRGHLRGGDGNGDGVGGWDLGPFER
ncbi:PKD domain-containing protein [Vulgatibacter sp.]|uniref:PKD domain-containing protein n=1 Tax=Vulgatibacter sp. TaxID=1971226 RepID=UPI00356326C3